MITNINKFCRSQRVDPVDDEGWRTYNPMNYYDHAVRRFHEGIPHTSDLFRHIINHFSSNINDQQIRRVMEYFKYYHMGFDDTMFGNDESELHVLKTLYFQRTPGGAEIKQKVMFGFCNDEFYEEQRIMSVREIDKSWRVKRTVFVATDCAFNWRKNKDNIFIF